jgi:hypothetical protein
MPESMTAPTATAPPSATDLYAPGCDPREAHGCSASPGSCGPTAPICGSKEPSRSRGTSTCTWPLLSVSTAFGRVPFRTLPGPGTSRPCFSCPGARSSPAKRGLQHRLGQLLQQPADSEAALHGGMREGCYRLRARRPRSQYGAADLNCLTRAPRRGGVTTPSCNIEDKLSRVAQCSASFPSSMRNQWLCSLVNRLPLTPRAGRALARHVRYSSSAIAAWLWPSRRVAKVIAEAGARNAALGLYLWLVVVTGVRRGELCGLQLRDVDLDRGPVYVALSRADGITSPATRLGHSGGGATTLRHYPDPVPEVDRRAAAYLAKLTAGSAAQSG